MPSRIPANFGLWAVVRTEQPLRAFVFWRCDMKIMVKEFRRYEKNTLKAFCDLELLDLCLVIKGCTVHQKEGRAWIGFPGRKYETEDGETAWANILEFSDDNKREEFRKDAVAVVKKFVEMENDKANTPKDTPNDVPF